MESNFVCLDLEMNQPSGKIVQIGYVIGNPLTGNIVAKESLYVDPEEPIDPFITDLCGISDNLIEIEGAPLEEAYKVLVCDALQHECHKMPIQWGGGDSKVLFEQLYAKGLVTHRGFVRGGDRYLFGYRHFDVKQRYQEQLLKEGRSLQGGLAKAMTRNGLKFEGKKHDACHDAYNTFLLYHKLLVEESV